MAEFRIQVFYQQGTGQKWTNVYRVDAADLFTAAAAASGTLAPDLIPLLHTSCQIVKVLTSTPGDPGAFVESALGLAGTGGGGADLLPLFNCVRVLFPILSGGRPDYKFLKGYLTEPMQANGLIDAGFLSGVEDVFEGIIADMSTAGALLVDNSGANWSTVTAQQEVQMRQMHRRRRRSTP